MANVMNCRVWQNQYHLCNQPQQLLRFVIDFIKTYMRNDRFENLTIFRRPKLYIFHMNIDKILLGICDLHIFARFLPVDKLWRLLREIHR